MKLWEYITSSICIGRNFMFVFIAVVHGDITYKATMNILKHKLQGTFAIYPYINLLSNDFKRIFSIDFFLESFILRKVPKRPLVNKYLLNKIISINLVLQRFILWKFYLLKCKCICSSPCYNIGIWDISLVIEKTIL